MENYLIRKDAILTVSVLSALRGPDTDEIKDGFSQLLKEVVTSRIRSLVFETYPGNRTSFPLNQVNLDHLKNKKQNDHGSGGPRSHFVIHLIDAIEATENNPVWGGYAQDLASLLRSFLR